MIELEKKLMLSKSEYDYILDCFGKDKPIITQVNYYFDTEDLSMNKEGITCRVRLKNGVYKGTIKKHTLNSDISTENEVKIQNGIYDNDFVEMGLQLQGELVTERCYLLRNSICEVVLDKNNDLGYTDYEIEIEYSKDNESSANGIFKFFLDVISHMQSENSKGIKSSDYCNGLSKSQRFFELKCPKIHKVDKNLLNHNVKWR